MTSSRPAQAAGIIAQQIREIAPDGKDSARTPDRSQGETPASFLPDFLPDLCSVTSVAALVLMGELLALVLVLTTDGLNPFNWQRLGLVSLTVQWAILPSAAVLCRLRPYLARLSQQSHKFAAAQSYTAVLVVLVCVLGVQHWWLADMAREPFDYWGLLANFLVGAICAGVVLRYAYVQQQLRTQQQAELGARIDALQSRIRPHFLFNSMNSLASLIAVDAARAEKLVEDLSALFRASLADSKLAPLEQEVVLAKRYLEIESLRLGSRLQQNWQIEELPPGIEIPTMLLQPLLENAVLHGVARLRAGGTIQITLRTIVIGRERGELLLSIENPIAAFDSKSASIGELKVATENRTGASAGNGMAMDNIRQRLSAFYGDRFRFHAEARAGNYRVELSLPIRLPTENGHLLKPARAPEQKLEMPEEVTSE